MSRRLPPAYRLHNEIAYVGKTIKASKRRVTWKFAFAGDQDEHSVVLLHTINSGKKVVFLNGNEIFEDDKMSLSQWVYPFQLEGHLITVVIEAAGTFSDKEGYDLQIDGRPWHDLKVTTLLDLRAAQARRAGGPGAAPAASGGADPWARGREEDGAGAGGGGGGGWDNEGGDNEYSGAPARAGRPGRESSGPAVPVASFSDFVGSPSSSGPSGAARPASGGGGAGSSGGGDAFDFGGSSSSGGAAGGAWDPFAGSGGSSSGGGSSSARQQQSSASSLSSASSSSLHHAPSASGGLRAPPSSSTGGGLRPPPGGSSAAGSSGAAASGGGAVRRPSGLGAVTDDLAGLSFGGGGSGGSFHAAPAPAPAAAHAAYDPFGDSAGAPPVAPPRANKGPSPAAGGAFDPMGDIFGSAPAPSTGGGANPFPSHALATAASSAPSSGGAASKPGGGGLFEDGLINLDNLNDKGMGGGASHAAGGMNSKPSLAQLKATNNPSGLATAKAPVMANNALTGASLGLSPLDPMVSGALGGIGGGPTGGGMGMGGMSGGYGGGMGMGGGIGGGQMGMGGMGMGTMGGGMGGGMGSMGGMGGGFGSMGGGMGMGGMGGMGSMGMGVGMTQQPQQQQKPAAAASFNPFE